jgi:NDP-sugar pyrophosphorylase family protein
MHPSQLFSSSMEEEFRNWLTRFETLDQLSSCRHELFSKLTRQQLDGVIDEQVTIIGPVHIGPATHVKSGSLLKGPLIIGPNAVIDYGAKLVAGTFVGAGTRVGAGAIVSDSLIMNRSVVSEGCVVRNAVWGCDVEADAGCLVGEAGALGQGQATFIGDGAKLSLGTIVCAGSIISSRERIPAGTVVNSR